MTTLRAIADDSALLQQYAAGGDPAAFAELVRRYADLVYSTARRVTGSPASAEDVAQDCFLRLAQGSASISGSLAGWLHRTSLNRSLELIRSEQARKRRESAAAAAERSRPDESRPGESRELIARVDEALAALPQEQRVLMTEHFLCGRSQVELAQALNLNQSTVSRRIEKGLHALREELRKDGSAAALGALPLLLQEIGKASAPTGVRQALTKIGLSGIGGGAGGASAAGATAHAGTGIAMKLVAGAIVLAVVFASGAALLRGRTAGPVAPVAGLDQAPPSVRKTIEAASVGGKIEDVEQKLDGKQTVYDVDVILDGKKIEVRVAQDGTLIWKRPG